MNTEADDESRLNAAKYLYLVSFGPTEDMLSVRFEIAEGVIGDVRSAPTEGLEGPINSYADAIEAVMGAASPIEVTEESTRYTITVDDCLAWCMRDEQFANSEKNEDYSKKFRSYAKSKFLDFVLASTWSFDEDRKLNHCAIVCLNAVIDIVSPTRPTVKMMRS